MTVNISGIVKTYSGRIGCMCGCLGKYNYTQDGADKHGPGLQDSVNERGVKIIAKRVLTHPMAKTEDNIVYVEDRVRNKIQVVYFKESV